MTKINAGEIINVSSIAAYTAVAGYATYSASKAYVSAFTESLAVRYASRGLRLMSLCPGFIRSEMHDPDEVPKRGLQAKFLWMDADDLVDIALGDLARGRIVCIPGGAYKASVALTKVTPRWVLAAAGKFANRGNQ